MLQNDESMAAGDEEPYVSHRGRMMRTPHGKNVGGFDEMNDTYRDFEDSPGNVVAMTREEYDSEEEDRDVASRNAALTRMQANNSKMSDNPNSKSKKTLTQKLFKGVSKGLNKFL